MKTFRMIFDAALFIAAGILIFISVVEIRKTDAQLDSNRKLFAEMDAKRDSIHRADSIEGSNPIAFSGPLVGIDTAFLRPVHISELPMPSLNVNVATVNGKIVDDLDWEKEINKYSTGFSLDSEDKGIWICDGQYYFHFIVAKGVLHLKSRAHWTSETCPPHGGD